MNRYPAYQFSIFRIYMGLYLLSIFLGSLTFSGDIWSNEGIVPEAKLNLTYSVFPGIVNYFDSPLQIKIFLVILSLLAVLFTVGVQRKIVALLLWYGWACLLNRNNLVINPSIHYIGWLLLACAVIPTGEPWSLSKQKANWAMPQLIFKSAWIFFALGYFLGGIDKFHSPLWVDGTAFKKIINGPLGYKWNGSITENIPDFLFYIFNWAALGLELICLPLALFTKTRKWAWYSVTILQFLVLLSINISPIVFGMLTIHIFTFNSEWLKKNNRCVVGILILTSLFCYPHT